jgi:hypothetical protein
MLFDSACKLRTAPRTIPKKNVHDLGSVHSRNSKNWLSIFVVWVCRAEIRSTGLTSQHELEQAELQPSITL